MKTKSTFRFVLLISIWIVGIPVNAVAETQKNSTNRDLIVNETDHSPPTTDSFNFSPLPRVEVFNQKEVINPGNLDPSEGIRIDETELSYVRGNPVENPNISDNYMIGYHNGMNYQGIGLSQGGFFVSAVYFPASMMMQYICMELRQVSAFFYHVPSTAKLKIFGPGTASEPGMVMHTQSISPISGVWMLIDLTEHFTITGEDLWIGIEYTHLSGTYPAGSDSGPAVVGFGDLISLDGINWLPMSYYGLNYNWNISGHLAFPNGCSTPVTDVDGNVYNTIQIGNQCWMQENLKTTRYRNGVQIDYPGDNNEEWSGNTTGAYAWYNNDEETYKNKYGALYNWFAVDNPNGLCPEGWHVPSHDDFTQLELFICNAKGNYDCETTFPYDNITDGWRGVDEGKSIKSCKQVNSPLGEGCLTNQHPRWNSHPRFGTDDFELSALPGGYRHSTQAYINIGVHNYWWSSSRKDYCYSWIRTLSYGSDNIYRTGMPNNNGFSVRCLKNVSYSSVNAGDDATICAGSHHQLNATASNYTQIQWTTSGEGTFDDPTILNPLYIPDISEYGTTVALCIEVSEDCSPSAEDCMLLTILPPSQIECPVYNPVCEGSDYIEFIDDGEYKFENTIIYGWDPYIAGVYTITYTVLDDQNCISSCDFEIVVLSLPIFECPEYGPYCEGDEFDLFVEDGLFFYEGTEILGWNPTTAGNYTIIYTKTIQYCTTSCSASCEFEIIVYPEIEVICPDDFEWCCDDPPILLSDGLPAGGIYSGSNVTFENGNYYFNPSCDELGEFVITYTYGIENSCVSNCYFIIIVNPQPHTLCPGKQRLCLNDAPFVYGDISFDPAQAGLGEHQVSYIIENACGSFTCTFTIEVIECETQGLPLNQGWSVISFGIQPFDPWIKPIWEDDIINGKFVIMLGKNGIFWPAGNINTLSIWDIYQGYKIKMNESSNLQIQGQPIEDKKVIVQPGANYLPVLSLDNYPAEVIFEQLGNGFHFAYDLNSGLLNWPLGGIYSLNVLEPGKGYIVGMTQPGEASYLPLKSNIINHVPATPEVFHNAPWHVQRTGSSHFIAINKTALSEFEHGDYIGVFNSQGICSGMTQYKIGCEKLLLIAYGIDLTCNSMSGFAEGEQMEFKVFRTSESNETKVIAIFNPSFPNHIKFSEFGQSEIIAIHTEANSTGGNEMSSVAIYPNPSIGVFTITGPGEKGNISIFNTLGNEVFNAALPLPAEIDILHVPAGIYFVKVQSDAGSFLNKIVIN